MDVEKDIKDKTTGSSIYIHVYKTMGKHVGAIHIPHSVCHNTDHWIVVEYIATLSVKDESHFSKIRMAKSAAGILLYCWSLFRG